MFCGKFLHIITIQCNLSGDVAFLISLSLLQILKTLPKNVDNYT